MSSHPFFRSHGRLEEATPPRTPSESLGPSRPSTPVSASTRTNDETSRSTPSDERGMSDASQCLFPIDWDKIRYDRKPVPSIRYRQPHKRVINSKSQPSAIYRHGAQLTTDGNNKYWLCKYCHISGRHDAALFASESTTSIIYHLKQQHRLEDFGYKATGSDPFSIAKRTASLTPYLGSRRVVFDDLKFKDDFTDWVIVLNLTFRQATHQRTNEIFTNYLEDIDKILPKSPSTLSSWVKEKWLGDGGRRVWLRAKLHSAKSKAHTSVDAWTSEEGTNYLAIVAHFLDEKHKLQTALLDLPPLKGPHSGENIAKVLSSTLDFYDISPLMGFFMMDNARSNDVCILELAEQYPTIRRENRLRCVGHMLNLIVKALLFGQGVSKLEQQLRGASDDERFEIWRKQSFIGKLHNFCVWINRSDQRRERLKQYILQAYEEGSIEQLYTRVLVDGGIRWNSVYAMIERALKLRHAIDLFFLHYSHVGEGYDISGDNLTPQDWVDLGHFHAILKPFKDLTKRMEGRANKVGREGSHGSLHETIESLDVLFKKLQEAGRFADDYPDVVSTYYSHAIDAARVKLEEYFGLTDASPAYRCAVALHPANKFTYFELEWSHNKQWISGAKRVVQEVFAQYEAEAEADLMDGARQELELEELEEKAMVHGNATLDPLQQARKRRQRLAVTAMSATRGKKRVKRTSELDEFMARTNKADLDVEDPLE
ncbi:putative AC transposase [Fusarium oxysporum f. sp. conglutinans]|nr:putative AC transposase [Fusarium oxysporum f. sp. conglutinans]